MIPHGGWDVNRGKVEKYIRIHQSNDVSWPVFYDGTRWPDRLRISTNDAESCIISFVIREEAEASHDKSVHSAKSSDHHMKSAVRLSFLINV